MKLVQRLSYANVMSTVAVFLALAAGGYAVATVSKNEVGSREVKRNSLRSSDLKNSRAVKAADVVDASLGGAEIADDGLTGAQILESSLARVPAAESAVDADTVDGRHADELRTSSAFTSFNQAGTGQVALTAAPQDVISTSIATTGTRVIAVAALELDADGGANDRANCEMVIAGAGSGLYNHEIPDTTLLDRSVMPLTFAAEVGPGTHPVTVRCDEVGAVEVEDAWVSAWAVGS